jgi:ribosomal protein L7/L12
MWCVLVIGASVLIWIANALQSKELVEGAPKTVMTGLVKEDADALVAKLVAAGGTAVVE